MSAAVGVLLACAVLAATGPRGRVALDGSRSTGPTPGPRDTEQPVSMQVLVTQVAALVRSGLPPGRAWHAVGVAVGPSGIPLGHDLADRARDTRRWSARRPGRRERHRSRRQAVAIVAACRLAAQVGAPLAIVLESIVATLAAAAEAEADRESALAGPLATARVLLWLPLGGAGLGVLLGADPVGLVTGGGPTALAPVLGGVLILVGRRWIARLVARARHAGSPP